MVVDELNSLRKAVPGCDVVAFADLSTQMVLVTSSDRSIPREEMDALSAEGSAVLGRSKDGPLGLGRPGSAVVATSTGLRIFLRASAEPSDALCCIAKSDLDVAAFLAQARPCLDRISGDG